MGMKYSFICRRFPNYSDLEKEDLLTFLMLLANATYGTFKDVPVNNRIPPEKYLDYIMSVQSVISYIISNSNVELFSAVNLVPTITELGLCYSYNGEIAPYNDYKLVA